MASEPQDVIKEDIFDEVVQDASVADYGDDDQNNMSIESAHIGEDTSLYVNMFILCT